MSIRIAMLDDHTMFRSGLRGILEAEDGFEIVGEAGNGPEAIRMAKDQEFDVLLLDIGLPGLSGPRVAEEILQLKSPPAIVVVTMHDDERYVKELFGIGVHGYLLKSSSGSELVQAIRAAYRGEHYIDPALSDTVLASYVGDPAPKRPGGRLGMLTPREQEVCRFVALGFTNAEIADQLHVSASTIDTHRKNIVGKLGLRNRAELVRFAMDYGLLKSD